MINKPMINHDNGWWKIGVLYVSSMNHQQPILSWMTARQWGLEDFDFEVIKYESPMAIDYDCWLHWAMEYFSSAYICTLKMILLALKFTFLFLNLAKIHIFIPKSTEKGVGGGPPV